MSLNLLTAQSPNILVIDERNNARWVISLTASTGTNPSLDGRVISRADGSGVVTNPNVISFTAREINANVTSGVWAFSYLCNLDGSRAVPLTDDEFTAICINVRNARRAKATATAAMERARDAFREAEAAVTAAVNAAAAAEREWNNAL